MAVCSTGIVGWLRLLGYCWLSTMESGVVVLRRRYGMPGSWEGESSFSTPLPLKLTGNETHETYSQVYILIVITEASLCRPQTAQRGFLTIRKEVKSMLSNPNRSCYFSGSTKVGKPLVSNSSSVSPILIPRLTANRITASRPTLAYNSLHPPSLSIL